MEIFVELSLIIIVATIVSGIMRLLKQPLIMGHILTGLIVGPYLLNFVHSQETVETFAKFGISILLFIVGLGLSPKVIKEVGKVSIITGLGQILFTTLFGFLISRIFGYDIVSSIFIALALTFSSTIIILKLLSDKKDTQKLYGRISIGFLLVQDVAATFILVAVSALSTGESAATFAVTTLSKGIVITLILLLVASKVLPKLGDFFAKSQEFLFIFSIGWGLGLATIFYYIGFSIEIGALIAGVTLSVTPYSQEIGSKLKPLRDFFIIMFFVLLGAKMQINGAALLIIQAIVFSLFVLIGNPIIVMALMGLLGYKKKTGFMAGLTVAQISEFSMILILQGVDSNIIPSEILSLVTIVGLITIAGSTYMLLYAEKIYPRIAPYLSIFERKKTIGSTTDILGSYEVVLFGCNRVGYDFLKLFKKLGQSFLVVDYDPEIVKALQEEGYNAKYGDAEDGEFLDEINIGESKLIVSTIPDFETNEYLISKTRQISKDVILISISYDIDQALQLYDKGATYIILPHFIGGHFAAMLAAEHWFHMDRFTKQRENHIEYLLDRKKLGHIHPQKTHT